ncbi:MAG: hypothetical protein ACPHL3_01570 [Paracoccaceae bacterium]|jgi:hypothetical protein
MEVTYTWEIGPMDVSNELMGDDVNDLEDAIRAIHWKFTGATEDTEAWIYGSAALEPVDVENWIAFEDVTEEKALEWILKTYADVEGESLEEAQARKEEQVNQLIELKSYVTTKEAPWA